MITVFGDKQYVKNYKKFNEAKIQGKLTLVEIINHGCGFQVDGNTDIFVFYPYFNEQLNDNKDFIDIAKPGDGVIKQPYSDTLFLIKSNKIYKYTFKKAD